MRKYFATWSPSRIRKVQVELIGEHEIYRPGSKLAGMEGTRAMYHFMGANTPKNDAAITRDGLQDAELVLKGRGGGDCRIKKTSG